MIVIYHHLRGEILRLLDIPAREAPRNTQPGETWIETPESVTDLTHYVVDGGLVPIPGRPSPHHTWDWSTKSWLPNLDDAITAKKRAIELERIRRNSLPITYDGKILDADLVAQKNLSDKISGVRERIRLNVGMDPAIMVWKDAGNTVHTWTDLQVYCDWLAGYVIALEDRGTRLYGAAWAHKINIDSLSNIESVLNYPVNSGWPE